MHFKLLEASFFCNTSSYMMTLAEFFGMQFILLFAVTMFEEMQRMAPEEMSCNYSILNLQSWGSTPHIDKLDVVDVEVY